MDSNQLLVEWRDRARVAQIGHYKTAVKLENRHRRIGLFVVVLNAVVGTAVFATLSEQANTVAVKVVVGLFSILAAVLAGVPRRWRGILSAAVGCHQNAHAGR